ncbi:MAG: ParA family protein [Myxococcota bacterium]
MKNFFRQGIKRIVKNGASPHADGGRRGTVIAVSSLKGGVGKSTTTVNLGAALARFHGKKTLLVDLDPQGHVETSLLAQVNAGEADARGRLLSQILTAEPPLQILEGATSTKIEGLHVTRSDAKLAEAENLIGTRIGKEMILKDALEVTRTHFDVVLIDCPPNMGNLTANALVACNWLLVPCDLSTLSLRGVDGLMGQCQEIARRLNPNLDLLGIVVTRYDGRTASMNQQVLSSLEERYGELLLEPRIGINTSLVKAQNIGKDIFEYAPQSRGAEHYRGLADTLMGRAKL